MKALSGKLPDPLLHDLALRAVGKPKLTLAQQLSRSDPSIHGGEAMAKRSQTSYGFQIAATNDTNPFALKFKSAKGETCYVLAHQPKSFACRERGVRP